MITLNIAAGKFQPLRPDNYDPMFPHYTLNIDTSYFSETKPEHIENDIRNWEIDRDRISKTRYMNIDAFEYMERTSILFDRVTIYRFLEHIPFTTVEYFIYLVSTVLEKNGEVDVIVPNYIQLAEMILNDNPKMSDFPEKNILLTTELLNEPACPHASIWTPARMEYFWELEGRFKIKSQNQAFKFDGRDIYLRSIIERI
jgi:hypothetical protein